MQDLGRSSWALGQRRSGTRRALRFLLVDVDPHLVGLLRERFPSALLVLLQPEDDLNAMLHEGPDLVVVDLSSQRLQHVQLFGDEVRVLGVGRVSAPAEVGRGVDAVLVRPYDPVTLGQTVNRLIEPTRPVARLMTWRRHPARILPFAELVALALAIPELAGGGPLPAAAVTLAAVVAVSPRARSRGYLLATALAAILLATSADPTSSFVPYALVVAARAGIEGSVRLGLACGAALALAAMPAALAGASAGPSHAVWLSTAVFPLTALAIGQAVRLQGAPHHSHDAREVHRTLTHLQGLVQWLPDDLSLHQAGHRIARDAGRTVGASIAILLTGRTVLRPLSSHGCTLPTGLRLAPGEVDVAALGDGWTPTLALPDALSSLPLGFTWCVLPLSHAGEGLGLLVLGKRLQAPAPAPRQVRKARRTASLDLANAVLLRRLQQLGTDAERTRLVRELKDGLAQSLSHVRFELASLERDLLAVQPNLAGRVRHVRQVARATMLDVAGAMADLRATSAGSGLTAAIHELARELMGASGPLIEVHGDAGPRLDPLAEQELFEITTDAVHAALRRSAVTYVTIRLLRSNDALRITVEDDGQATAPDLEEAAPEADVRQERAERVGATLTLTMPDARHHRFAVTLPRVNGNRRSAGS